MIQNNQTPGNAHGINAKRMPVHFAFADPKATTVCIAGTFNHWQPEAKPLHSSGAGNWWKEMFLDPGTYEYCLVVDGKWMTDPLARESVPNPFGGRNSILRVATSPEAAHLADAENVPLNNDRFGESITGDHLIAGEDSPVPSGNNQK
ncbi:MAG: glycogen-binding domain-containing protein [Verrucomicrobiae bacterium]|nr:glycogen-binding domain-containing protein [Verrucomicrobiae bacterium]